jgi:hypothetical protein
MVRPQQVMQLVRQLRAAKLILRDLKGHPRACLKFLTHIQ